MNLQLDEQQELLRGAMTKLFAAKSTPDRVRAAERTGFDVRLWESLIEFGLPALRVPEDSGGSGGSLMDAVLVAECAGAALASVPLAEHIVATRILAQLDAPKPWLERAMSGVLIVPALHDVMPGQPQAVPGGAVAEAILALEGQTVFLLENRAPGAPKPNLGTAPIVSRILSEAAGERLVLAEGPSARAAFLAGIEEWKLMTSAALVGLAEKALRLAAAYSCERQAFGRPIGSYQGISHPLADQITDVEGGRLLVWKAISAIAQSEPQSAAFVSMAFWWASQTAAAATARALHTFGGYGVSLEQDIQLYYRRAKAIPLAYGDPQHELLRAGERLWGSAPPSPLPDAGSGALQLGWGPDATAFAEEARAFLGRTLTPDLREHRHHSVDGFHPEFNKTLARAGFLFPHWPKDYGGGGRTLYDFWALVGVLESFGWEHVTSSITNSVGQMVLRFASDEIRQRVMLEFSSGAALGCLGFTEPSCGSDLFAIKTRADRSGDNWIINGQKIFTTSANLAKYCFLLARTDPTKAKHAGLTIFLVPLDTPGVEIQAVHTLQDERTNIVFLSNVHISDAYRIGGIDEGIKVMAAMLELEHGGAEHYRQGHDSTVRAATRWALNPSLDGKRPIDNQDVVIRLARAQTHLELSTLLCRRAIWGTAEGMQHRYWGPMAKVFSTEYYLRDAMDLMDLAAPMSLFSDRHGAGVAQIEIGFRQSVGTTIYGGTSEVQRSLIAEQALGMPKSRS